MRLNFLIRDLYVLLDAAVGNEKVTEVPGLVVQPRDFLDFRVCHEHAVDNARLKLLRRHVLPHLRFKSNGCITHGRQKSFIQRVVEAVRPLKSLDLVDNVAGGSITDAHVRIGIELP